jgi:4-amino-4-deoxy-L-arabinose transferase-like glycosyltransferase
MVLPWYIAVQHANPSFLHEFIVGHNLERFATNRFQHRQSSWYYLIVLLIGLMPWTVMAMRALVEALRASIAEWKVRINPRRYLGFQRTGDAFPEFLVLWALFPILFFTFSESKLPGYILPSIPPLTILTGDYLNRVRRIGLPGWLLWSHASLCGLLVFVLVLAPQHMVYETLVPPVGWLIAASIVAIAIAVGVVQLIRHRGIAQVRNATLIPVLATLVFLLGFHGKELDLQYSARPLAREMKQQAPNVRLVAVQDVKRDMVYGLAFYRNQPLVNYEADGVPDAEHLLVLPSNQTSTLPQLLPDRIYEPLFLYDPQGLAVYRVYPKPQ